MELRDLEVAIAVADSGSVTRASTVLHMSPSSVSQIVSRLEAQLGGRLFYRLARGMALTSTGAAFIGLARRTLSEAAAVVAAVAQTEGLESARIRVAPLRTLTAPIVDLVAAFDRAHPGVVVTLEAAKDDSDIAELVKSGDCEIGFMRSPVTLPGLDATVVGEEKLVALVPRDLALADACSVKLRDLDDQPMVGPPSGTALRDRWDELFETVGVKPRMVAETLEHDAIRMLQLDLPE